MTKLEQPSASPSDDRGGNPELGVLVSDTYAALHGGCDSAHHVLRSLADRAYALGAKAEAERATADDAVAVRNAAMWKAGYEAGVAERADEDRPAEKPAVSLGDVVTEAGEAIAERASELYFDAVTIRRDAYAAVVAPFIYRVYDAGIGVGRAHEAYLAELSVAADRVERDERAGGGETEPAAFDSVNRPAHYAATRIECIDAIGAMVESWPGESAYYAGNVVKYVWRHRGKQSVESLRKARWYLDRLIALVASSSVARGDTPNV